MLYNNETICFVLGKIFFEKHFYTPVTSVHVLAVTTADFGMHADAIFSKNRCSLRLEIVHRRNRKNGREKNEEEKLNEKQPH